MSASKVKVSRQRSKKATKKVVWDPKKDNIFKLLATVLAANGMQVRREDLKQGHGWRVVSGTCRAEDKRLIFVDRKLPQDDQIAFLATRIAAAGIALDDEQRAALPEKIVAMIYPTTTSAAA